MLSDNECRVFILMLSVSVLSVIVLSVIVLSAIALVSLLWVFYAEYHNE